MLEQPWVDLVTTSVITALEGLPTSPGATCPEAAMVRSFAAKGGIWFAHAGNQDLFHPAFAPSGVPEAYRVGGVNADGRTYLLQPAEEDEGGLTRTPTRPYETGDLFSRRVAAAGSVDGKVWRNGTSFATPTTAGRVASLLRYARRLVGSTRGGIHNGRLVTAATDAALPAAGPLADGSLTRSELIDLLHHVAVPAEPPSPTRYLVEGYGALNDVAMRRAERVLAGLEPEPSRPEEDAMHAQVEAAFARLFPSQRCGT